MPELYELTVVAVISQSNGETCVIDWSVDVGESFPLSHPTSTPIRW